MSSDRSRLLIGAAVAVSALLVFAYLAAGGASYQPAEVRNPCEPREWRSPDSIEELAEQFTLSALDGAGCELRVSRETLARALATPESREAFSRRYGIGDEELEAAVRAGLVRAIDDAEDAGALSPLVAIPLRGVAQRVPVDEAIELINDARPIFADAWGLLDQIPGLLEDAQTLLPGNVRGLIP